MEDLLYTNSDFRLFCLFYIQYNIKKKEELVEAAPQEEPANPLMRKKKTPEELAAEAEQEDLDDFTSKLRGLIEVAEAERDNFFFLPTVIVQYIVRWSAGDGGGISFVCVCVF